WGRRKSPSPQRIFALFMVSVWLLVALDPDQRADRVRADIARQGAFAGGQGAGVGADDDAGVKRVLGIERQLPAIGERRPEHADDTDGGGIPGNLQLEVVGLAGNDGDFANRNQGIAERLLFTLGREDFRIGQHLQTLRGAQGVYLHYQ